MAHDRALKRDGNWRPKVRSPRGETGGRARLLGAGATDRSAPWHKTTTTERQTEMSNSEHANDFDHQKDNGRLETGLSAGMSDGPRRQGRRHAHGTVLARALAAGAGTGALVAALALPAAASGSPNPWEGAQVGLTYPVYQPKTVLALPQSSFKLLSCGSGQDESIFATFGTAYTPRRTTAKP